MKKYPYVISALLAGAFLFGTGCSDDEPGRTKLAAKTTLTLEKYYNAAGSTTSLLWQNGEQAAMLVAGAGKSAPALAAPILTGVSSSLFLFNVTAPQEAVPVAACYPADAVESCEDGVLKTTLPTEQDGTVAPLLIGHTTAAVNAYEGCRMELSQLWCTMYIRINKGNYSIAKAVVEANAGENIAGEITVGMAEWNVSASAASVAVTPAAALDCREGGQILPVLLAPVTLSAGYTVTLTNTEGEEISVVSNTPVALEQGGKIDTSEAASTFTTQLLFFGDNMAYQIDSGFETDDYKQAIVWSWDARSAASTLGIAESQCRVGEGKPVENGTQLLLTGATGWSVLLEKATKQILWWSASCPQVHSAELLPGNRVALACSTGDAANCNKVQIYDVGQPNRVLAQYNLYSAHGVVWNETTQRLYAIGGQSLQIYKLKAWETSSPGLELERTVQTPKNGLHDLTYVNAGNLCIAGKSAYIYNIGTDSFTELSHFKNSTALKSVNYNEDTGAAWYTDATEPEGNETWSTHTLRYTSDVGQTYVDRTISIPDVDVYKVRVLSW